MDYDPVIEVVNRITGKGLKARKVGSEFKCQCPAHADKGPSLQVGYGDKGAVLHCHAGCTNESIVAALDMTLSDLYTEKANGNHDDALMPLHAAAPGAEATYVYEDELGAVLFRVERRPGKKFVQARPDPHQPGNWLYTLGSVRRVLYHLPNVIGAVKSEEVIFMPEGEKDVHNLEAEGLVATCNPGGAGKFKREYAEFLTGAHVVLLPDNDPVGFEHAAQICDYLKEGVRSVKVLELPGLPDKGDVTDWLHLVKGLAAVFSNLTRTPYEVDPAQMLRYLAKQVEPVHTNKPVIFNAESLMEEVFPDVVMAVPGVIAEGATFLVGAPKIGKSWMALQLGVAVAQGGMALGTIPVEEGKVLYLALEDTPRRLQRRLVVMLGAGVPAPANLNFACTWPRMGAGGLDQLEDWFKENQDCRMCIIDTWAKVKSSMGDNESMYQADYSAVSAVKSLADTYGVAIVMVHHQRKAGDSDPLNTVAGSTGLTGAADATVVLTRPRGQEEGMLYVTGRDVEESKSIVSFDASTGSWTWLGEADDVEETRTEDGVTKLLSAAEGPLGPKDVATALDMKEGTAKWLLAKLATEGKIIRLTRGKYTVATNTQAMAGGAPATGTAIPQGGAIVGTVQPPLPGTPGKDKPMGPMHVTDDEIEDFLADDEGFGDDDEQDGEE